MNKKRLKNPQTLFGKYYFEEQLAHNRDIRSSERRFYQKITDIYSQCNASYEAGSEVTKTFFATVQNKLDRKFSKQTAAKIIVACVDTEKPNMELTNWENVLNGMIRKPDVSITKNCLNKTEMDNLNLCFDVFRLCRTSSKKAQVIYMKDWVKKLGTSFNLTKKRYCNIEGR